MPAEENGAQLDIERIVETYSDMMLRIALHHTQNQGDAEDAVQSVFLKMLRAAPSFADAAHEKAWLIRVTINQCKDTLRLAWNRKTTGLEDVHAAPATGQGFEVMNVVRTLPEDYRDAVYLYYYEGYSTVEIAEMLGVQRGTVESRLHRARAKLHTLMEGEWNA